MRRRGSPTGRRHNIMNIHRISVINNFAAPIPNYFSTPPKERLGWCALRILLALLVIVWFGAMASILKSTPPPSPQSKAASNLSRWKELSEHIKQRRKKVNGKQPPMEEGDIAKEGDSKTNINITASTIFELSMFGNKSPSDFQLYTPYAPSCSKPLDAHSVSYTLVSQLSNDRLWMVPYHCERWGENPMSIVVFTDTEAADIKSQLVSEGCSTNYLTVQTVKKSKYDPGGTEYPVNLLRNMAASVVKTTHIMYADVDFWPASDLHSILSGEKIKERLASDPKLATVIPVFQMYRLCKEYKDCRDVNIPSMPRTKDSLLALIKQKKASTFDPTNVGGHGSTKYITWRDQETGTFVDLPCIKSNRYEPYLVFRYCSELPPFQEGFAGYGKNKMTVRLRMCDFSMQFVLINLIVDT